MRRSRVSSALGRASCARRKGGRLNSTPVPSPQPGMALVSARGLAARRRRRRALLAAIANTADLDAAVFRFAIDLPPFWKRFIELGQRLRERLTGLCYGDQGLLVRRALFNAVGGYADVPVMEDVVMLRRLRRHGVTVRTLPAALVTSGRRYRAHGVLRPWFANVLLIFLYLVGVPPRHLARWGA